MRQWFKRTAHILQIYSHAKRFCYFFAQVLLRIQVSHVLLGYAIEFLGPNVLDQINYITIFTHSQFTVLFIFNLTASSTLNVRFLIISSFKTLFFETQSRFNYWSDGPFLQWPLKHKTLFFFFRKTTSFY